MENKICCDCSIFLTSDGISASKNAGLVLVRGEGHCVSSPGSSATSDLKNDDVKT